MKELKLRNVTLRNPRVPMREPDGSILVTLDISEDGGRTWSEAVHVARDGDEAPATLWILDLVRSGQCGKLIDVPFPEPLEPRKPFEEIMIDAFIEEGIVSTDKRDALLARMREGRNRGPA